MTLELNRTKEALGLSCASVDLGLVSYSWAAEIQERMVRMRARGALPSILLLAEHPPTFTVGRFKRTQDFKVSRDSLLEQGLAICQSDRGGGVIYHGPGQLLTYPILSLRQLGLSVLQYVRSLEEVALQTLAAFQIRGDRRPGYPGIWVGGAKMGFIGLHISHGICKHGLALNVNTDLSYFDYIYSCGISEVSVTSMAEIRGAPLEMGLVKEGMLEAFRSVFSFRLWEASLVFGG